MTYSIRFNSQIPNNLPSYMESLFSKVSDLAQRYIFRGPSFPATSSHPLGDTYSGALRALLPPPTHWAIHIPGPFVPCYLLPPTGRYIFRGPSCPATSPHPLGDTYSGALRALLPPPTHWAIHIPGPYVPYYLLPPTGRYIFRGPSCPATSPHPLGDTYSGALRALLPPPTHWAIHIPGPLRAIKPPPPINQAFLALIRLKPPPHTRFGVTNRGLGAFHNYFKIENNFIRR
ncbi:hypothetical protein Fcan01_27744 [Folsomia candida]|uniref:Uncharacterized protein n=1 Tax=Folsomia candida TaxID=158441 RepID=A0A226CXK2_FOLCA|nr:hypothetical protein Fcan01_27744 [Folsomia candida]